jgi:Ca2+-binding EF-hand superfamily protein
MKGKEGCPKATKMEKISKILDEDHDGKISVADLNKVFNHALCRTRSFVLNNFVQNVNCAKCARMKAKRYRYGMVWYYGMA